jgi:hypothetical protein
VVCHVRGHWDALPEIAARAHVSESCLPARYAEALGWLGAGRERGHWADAA